MANPTDRRFDLRPTFPVIRGKGTAVALYLDTSGFSSRSIAICDRCRMKMAYDLLSADRNFPGLRVCAACTDNLDPWRLPARMSENITIRYPRPDEPLSASGGLIIVPAIAGVAIAGASIAGLT